MSTLAEEKIDVSAVASAEDHSGRPSYDDVNVPFVVVLGIISAIVTYVSIIGVQGLYYHFEDAQIREKEYGATIAAAKTIEEQKESLNGFYEAKVRAEGEKPVQSIPIDLAMNLTLAQFANDSHANESHADEGHDSDNQKAGGHDSDHDKAAGDGEEDADTNSDDNPKANEETNDKDDETSTADQADAETKSSTKDSVKADDGVKESKSDENRKEDDSEEDDSEEDDSEQADKE